MGCPVGSVLVGDEEIMRKSRSLRKLFGGNMRQAGYLAAAGLYALNHNVERLEKDHKKAKEIGEVLKSLSKIKRVEPIETNIIIFELKDDIDESLFLKQLADKRIHIISMGSKKLRIVTHLDYTDAMHDIFLNEMKTL